MRSRNIKPGLIVNEHLGECSIGARYLFAVLPMAADRMGRLIYSPKRLKAILYPYDGNITGTDVEGWVRELLRFKGPNGKAEFIQVYDLADGQQAIQITHFLDHQHPHPREAVSTIPAIPNSSDQSKSSTDNNLEPRQDLGMTTAATQATPRHGRAGQHNESSTMNPATLKVLPAADAGGDDLDSQISQWIGDNQLSLRVMPCPKTFQDFRKLITAVGWDRACEMVAEMAGKPKIVQPVAVALKAASTEQGIAAATKAADKPTTYAEHRVPDKLTPPPAKPTVEVKA